jgi:hypothetical protein
VEYDIPYFMLIGQKHVKLLLERRNKTSFLCFSFDFLPASLVHHMMFRLLEKYSVSEDHTGETAIYYRTLVLDYEPVKKQKLYFLSQKHELLFQIWLSANFQSTICIFSI